MTKFERHRVAGGAMLRQVLLVLGTAALLAGCGKKVPEGQVVAVVNGQEVTRRELAAEPGAASMAQEDAAPSALGAMLSGVVDRKLAAAEARHLELDSTPQYVAQAKRLDEVMLSRTLFEHWAAQVPAPDRRAVADYVAHNPQRFDGRKLLLVDRIESDMDRDQSGELAPLQTMDAIARYLDAHSQAYRRSRTVIDTATLPLPLYRQLLAQSPGSPLALVQDQGLVALAVVETRDAPLPEAERSAAAATALKQVAVQEKLAALRKSAAIAYQPGYRPEAPGDVAAGGKPKVAH
jgi:EpsD family peptidyl-prolyl cis-trans isomerase